MRTPITAELGAEYPIFAFSHCRDVVAEISRLGGFGVLGAGMFNPDQLELELRWIDEHCGGAPYGVDAAFPLRTADTGSMDTDEVATELFSMLPIRHRQFVREVLRENGIEPRPMDAPFRHLDVVPTTAASTRPLIDVMLGHPKVKLFVNALGTPPRDVVDRLHSEGLKVGALAGSRQHAERHVRHDVDVVIAQGTEAGGHTGEIATMVLTPEVVEAVSPLPVLAAGGIGSGRQVAAALALGAQGAWTGSLWLTVNEAATTAEEKQDIFDATSSDTVRSRAISGKPIRQLRSPWTEAWARPEAPPTLQMPLQNMLLADALPDELAGVQPPGGLGRPIVGQVVGRLHEVRSTRAVFQELVEDFIDVVGELYALVFAQENTGSRT